MPYYFTKMIRQYFMCDDSAVYAHIDDFNNLLDIRSNVMYDFIDSTVRCFGPPSYSANTPTINKLCFEMWRKETYAVMTRDVELDNLTEIEMNKCNEFWDAIEMRNLRDDLISASGVEDVFSMSPVNYQRLYIEMLAAENAQQNHADNIEAPDHADGEDDYESDEEQYDEEESDGEVVADSDEEDILESDTEAVINYDGEESDYDDMPGLISCSDYDSDDDYFENLSQGENGNRRITV